jgi:hypothetical protein
LITALGTRLLQAQTETVLYNFTGGSDGGNPYARLTSDGKGNVYGTTVSGGAGGGKFGNCNVDNDGCGTVFELSPNGQGDGMKQCSTASALSRRARTVRIHTRM